MFERRALVDRRASPERCRPPSATPSASDSCAVACASQILTSTVPKLKCGRTDHQTCVNSTIERVAIRNSR